MTYGLNSSFKRQLNNISKNKRLLAVIIKTRTGTDSINLSMCFKFINRE